jgi:DNA primase
MSILAVEKLKEIVDPTQLITALGFNIFKDTQDEIRCSCIIHGGDNKTAFSFRKRSRRFYCFTHSCETDEDGQVNNDIISLVIKARRCSFVEAIHFLSELTGFNVDFNTIDKEEEARFNNKRGRDRFIQGTLNKEPLTDISEDLVKGYVSRGADYFKSIDISEDIIRIFELGTMFDNYGIERGTVPIRDERGTLVSISGRRAYSDEEPRYLLLKEFQKRKVLYNLHNAIKYKEKYSNNIIIVEGFKALWHVYSSGFPNVVAVMGKVLKPEQRNLLVKMGFGCSILLLDGDNAGREGTEKSMLLLKGKMEVRPIYLPQDVSPDDISLDDINTLISSFIQ